MTVAQPGQVHGTLAALERMRPRNHGVIVNVVSAMVYRSIPLQAAYCGAKHAIKGFTESVRRTPMTRNCGYPRITRGSRP